MHSCVSLLYAQVRTHFPPFMKPTFTGKKMMLADSIINTRTQLDMALSCLVRALGLASDETVADVWYNISHVGMSLGDISMAYQVGIKL